MACFLSPTTTLTWHQPQGPTTTLSLYPPLELTTTLLSHYPLEPTTTLLLYHPLGSTKRLSFIMNWIDNISAEYSSCNLILLSFFISIVVVIYWGTNKYIGISYQAYCYCLFYFKDASEYEINIIIVIRLNTTINIKIIPISCGI